MLQVVHSLSVGGVERNLVSLVRRSDGDRIQQVVCTIRQPGLLAAELPDRTKLESLNIRNLNRLSAWRLAAVIRRRQPDIVHARNFNTWTDCILACRLAGLDPPVLGFHGLETPEGFTVKQRRRAAWLRLSSRQFTTVSSAGALTLQRDLDISDDHICVLPNGVDTEHFAPPDPNARDAARRDLKISPEEFVVVTVASLVPVKDHATIVEAVRQNPPQRNNYRMLIVGDGPLRSTLEKQARGGPAGVKWTFLGALRNVRSALHAADLFVLSSRFELMSNAVLEAMACGLSIIATDVGNNAELVEQEYAGLIVPSGDAGALGRSIARLATDPALRLRFGERARKRVCTEYGLHNMVDRYTRYYESLLAKSKGEVALCAASQG